MLEKIGRVRLYQQNLKRGWITFDDNTSDIPAFYNTLKANGLEYLKTGEEVLVALDLDKKGNGLRIVEIKLLKDIEHR